MLYPPFEKSGAAARIVRHFSSQDLDVGYTKEVVTDFLLWDLLDGLLQSNVKNYYRQISDALMKGKGSLRLMGSLRRHTNPEFAGDGLEVELTFEDVDLMKKVKMAWALAVGAYKIHQYDEQLKSLYHVRETLIEKMKAPVHHIYDKLYNALKAYVHGGEDGNGFYTGYSEETKNFYVSFYKPREKGMAEDNCLTNKGVKSIELSLENEEEFQKDLARVVCNMVKHMATIVIKHGTKVSPILVLVANQFRVLDEEYIHQNFYGKKIQVNIFNKYRDKKGDPQWKDSKEYNDDFKDVYEYDPATGGRAFQISNAFPIYAFRDAELFAELFAEIMSQCPTLSRSIRDFRPEYLS